MDYKIRRLSKSICLLGEGTYWSNRDNCLYWVDIKGQHIFRYNPENQIEEKWNTPETIGFVVEDPDSGNMLGGLRKGIARITLPDKEPNARIDYVVRLEQDLPRNRFNDGNIDPFGNIWAGSMDDLEKDVSGSWWHIDQAGIARHLLAGFKVANGPAFSPDGLHIYLTDSAERKVYRAKYDAAGTVSNYRLWKKFGEDHGYPDGMNFDPQGVLWIAFWDGACIKGFDESGRLVQKLTLPVHRPTKPVFSPDGTGYVASASIGLQGGGMNGSVLEIKQ